MLTFKVKYNVKDEIEKQIALLVSKIFSRNMVKMLMKYSSPLLIKQEKDRKITGGNIFLLGKSHAQWITKKQTSVGRSKSSLAEIEYISVTNATHVDLWIIKLLEDLDMPIKCQKYYSKMNRYVYNCYNHRNIHPKPTVLAVNIYKTLNEISIVHMQYWANKLPRAEMMTKPPIHRPDFVSYSSSSFKDQEIN